MIRNDNGITLVALIITIIIMIILASIAIGKANTTDIIKYAENSTNQFAYAQQLENNFIQNYTNLLLQNLDDKDINVWEKVGIAENIISYGYNYYKEFDEVSGLERISLKVEKNGILTYAYQWNNSIYYGKTNIDKCEIEGNNIIRVKSWLSEEEWSEEEKQGYEGAIAIEGEKNFKFGIPFDCMIDDEIYLEP